MKNISGSNIITARLTSQRLNLSSDVDDVEDTILDTVRWMGATQAQDYGQAVWGLGVRTKGASLQTVVAAIETGEIIRTWPMRGTVHFIPAEDAEWMLSLGAVRIVAADKRRMELLELDEAILGRCTDVLSEALHGRKLLARPQVLQILEDRNITTKDSRGYHILWRLSQAGILCIGPMLGKQQSFALLHEWAPRQRQLSREEALATLAVRYFSSHGPATVYDFGWWSGLTMADCKHGLELAKANVVSYKIDGMTYWYNPALVHGAAVHASSHSNTSPVTLLLPGFDEYFLGYKDRSAITDPVHIKHIVPGGNGVFKPIIVVDGRVIGTWQRKILKNLVEIRLASFDKIRDLGQLVSPAAEAYARFHGLELKLSV